MKDETSSEKEKSMETSASTTHNAHGISSLADLPGKEMKTKLWPMSPIRSLSAEEVLAIANRDETPVMIGVVLDGNGKGEQYVCANKKGASIPPDVAAEGSWAKKYYQQVVVLNDTMKDMKEKFQPVWELAKGQQAVSVSVELFDGLMAVANQGFQQDFLTWTFEDRKAMITTDCDFKSPNYATYYSVLRNYTLGRFASLDANTFQWVEDLLESGERYITSHAHLNGFNCPLDIRRLFQLFIPLKSDRNSYSHPLTLAAEPLANTVLQKLRIAVTNDEIECMKGCKDLVLLGADYGEVVLQSYGKIKDFLFLNPNKNTHRPTPTSPPTAPSSPDDSPPHSPLRPRSPEFPLFGVTQNASSSQVEACLLSIQSNLDPKASPFIPSHRQSSSSLPSSQSSPSPGGSPSPPMGAAQKSQQQPQQGSNSPGKQQLQQQGGSHKSAPQQPQQGSNNPGKQQQQGSHNATCQQPQQGSNNPGKQRQGSHSPPAQQPQQGSHSPGKQQQKQQGAHNYVTQQWQPVSHNSGNQQQQGSQRSGAQQQNQVSHSNVAQQLPQGPKNPGVQKSQQGSQSPLEQQPQQGPHNPGNQQHQQGSQGTSSQQPSQSNSPSSGSKRPGSQSGDNAPNKR